MELLFLWIENFRSVHKQAFNFSSSLTFTILPASDTSVQRPAYSIKIDLNPQFVNLFPADILNITGLIGKNGSGKSSLLHCLKLLTGQFARLTSPLIFSILDRSSKHVYTYYYGGGGIREMKILTVSLVPSHSVSNQYKVMDGKPYTISRLQGEKGTVSGLDFDIKKIATCFYSNSFDSHRETIYEGVINISSNFLVDDFLKKYIKKEIEKSKRKKARERELVLWPSDIAEFHKLELRSTLRFLAYANRRKTGQIPDLPKSLTIEFNFDDYEYLINVPSSEIAISEVVTTIHEHASKLILQEKSAPNRFYNLILLCTFYYYLRWHIAHRSEYILKNHPSLQNLSEKFSFRNLQHILFEISNISSVSSINIMRYVTSENFSTALKKVKFIVDKSDTKTHFEFKINNALWPVLSAIYNLSHVEEIIFIDYAWNGGLSTGEEAYLKHFSRLNDVRPLIRNETLWLLIDEGDLYFHPQWQKGYLDNLLRYVSFLFHNRKVQIILTTHSPFIVSDLPKQNLIFLKKGDDGMCIVADEKLQSETFGANIHELFSNSFFIHDGLMGEFAKNKINEVITCCKSSKPLTQQQTSYFKSLIGIIGEPLIKYKLVEMLASKVGDNTEEARLQSQRDEIERRLNELRRNDPNKT